MKTVILSPKTDFLGGALVSAAHLGKLFPDRLYLWKKESDFLKNNGVPYTVINEATPAISEEVWCNDICVDGGYYPQFKEENFHLFEYLSKFKVVHLHNHQPLSRCGDYLSEMVRYLKYINPDCKVHLYNYRGCWNDEFYVYCRDLVELGFIQTVTTSPYHYHFGYLPNKISRISDEDRSDIHCVSIGRSSSKCKISSCLCDLKDIFHDYSKSTGNHTITVGYLEPDLNLGMTDFFEKLLDCNPDVILSGYYWGGEGVPEDCSHPGNKLEWSFLDTILLYRVPITSELFRGTLNTMFGESVTINYQKSNLSTLPTRICKSFSGDYEGRIEEMRRIVVQEIERGNEIMKRIIL